MNLELDFCGDMDKIATYLYFSNFLFNWCPFYVKSKKCFVCLWNFKSLCWFQFEGFGNASIWMIVKGLLYNLQKFCLQHLQDHLMLHSSLHMIQLTYFFKLFINGGSQLFGLVSLTIWNENDIFKNEFILHEMWMFDPIHVLWNMVLLYSIFLHLCKINVANHYLLVVISNKFC